MRNLKSIATKTEEIEVLIESFNGAINITHRAGDDDADELVIEGRSYTVEVYIYADRYELFTSDYWNTYTPEERCEGKNHKTVKTMKGVKSYINKFALDM